MTMVPSIAVLLSVAVLLVRATDASTATPDGNPHIDITLSAPNYNGTDVSENIATWLSTNTALGSEFGVALNGTAVHFYDDVSSGTEHSMNVTVLMNGINNVQQYFALRALRDALEANSVLGDPDAYSTVFAKLHENPASSVQYDVDPMSVVYQHQVSPTYTISLSASPRIGKNVTFHVSPVAGTVQFNTSRVVIAWPALKGYFHARAGDTVTTCGVSFDSVSGSDNPARYTAGASVGTEVMTVRELETIDVNPVSSSQRLYTGRKSPDFTLVANQHRDTSFDLVVTVVISPDGLVAEPGNVSLRQPGEPATFTVSGDPGTYTIGYLVGHVYRAAGGGLVGTSNPDFKQIDTTSTITVQPTLNASSASIPDGYLVNPVTSADYGGAYSQEVPFHIERDPVPGTQITVTPSASTSTTVEVSPSSVTFYPGGARLFAFQYRAHGIGIHRISFDLSGPGAGDYAVSPSSRRWIVHGRNPKCLQNTASGACFATPGCTWNQARAHCTNGTLPIAIDAIPLLYHDEVSVPLNFTLPTPVRSSLTVTFEGDSRLTFDPPTILLVAGESVGRFTITANLLSSDTGRVRGAFQLRLSGASANMYDEQRAYAFARPKVQCFVTAPTQGFFVHTVSAAFVLDCQGASPETEVIFTPTSSMSGIEFIADAPGNSNVLHFTPGQSSMRFFANSTSNQVGTVTLTVTIAGTNAARYASITPVSFRVIESGVVNVPPTFHMTAYEESAPLHLDLSVPPPQPLNVTIRAVNNDSSPADSNITVNPPVLTFNQSQRSTFTVSSRGIGWFYLAFSITGPNVRNYVDPSNERVAFESKDPLSGRAFDARLRPGYLGARKQCRVSVGRQSVDFRGQAPVDRTTEFCQQHPSVLRLPNETYNCSQLPSEERCRDALATLGHACAWHQDRCTFLQQMQGNILGFAYGSGFTVFLSLSGEVYSVGVDRYGQLGHHNTSIDRVPLSESVAVIAAGSNHVMALTYSGRVFTWGANQNGQLGQNTRTQHRVVPDEVQFPKGENITCISSGTLHLAALSMSGRLFVWGSNQYGQLGTRASYRSYVTGPIPLGRDLFNGDAVVAVTLGEYHSMAATDEAAYTWGSNTMGQLGRPGFDDPEPKQPVHWVRDRWSSAPTYASYLLGRDC